LLFQNLSAELILGLTVQEDEELPEKISLDDMFLPYIIQRKTVAELIKSICEGLKTVSRNVKVMRKKDKGYHNLTVYIITDPDSGRPAILIIEDDITPLVLKKKELRKEIRDKSALKKAKNKAEIFLGAMSHEIRTPLHGIIGLTNVLLEEPTLLSETRRLGKSILTSGEHLLTLVNNTLDITKIEAERLELKIAQFDPYACIEQVIDWLCPMALEKGIHISPLLPINLPMMKGDVSRIGQILLNFLSNALKFTSSGTVEINVHLSSHIIDQDPAQADFNSYYVWHDPKVENPLPSPSAPRDDYSSDYDQFPEMDKEIGPRGRTPYSPDLCTQREDIRYIHYLITDTGPGIKKSDMEKLFERFSQLSNSSFTRQTYLGSGLGLFICRELAILMGGAVGVRSKVDVGSTFWLSIPIVPDELQLPRVYNFTLDLRVIIFDERPIVLKTMKHYFNIWRINSVINSPVSSPEEVYTQLSTIDNLDIDLIFISNKIIQTEPSLYED